MANKNAADRYRAKIRKRLVDEKVRKDQEQISQLEALLQLKDAELAAKSDELKSTYNIDDVEMEDAPEVSENKDEAQVDAKQTDKKNEEKDNSESAEQPDKSSQTGKKAEESSKTVEKNEREKDSDLAKAAENSKKHKAVKISEPEHDSRKHRKSPSPKIMESIEHDDASDSNEDSQEGLFSEGDVTEYTSDDSATYSDGNRSQSLFSFPGRRLQKDVKTENWCGGRSTKFINRHGKRGAPIHRIENFAYPLEYERDVKKGLKNEDKVSHPKYRKGDKTDEDGGLLYTKYDMEDIYGVAWQGIGLEPSREDLDLINPDLVTTRWRTTYVKVGWIIEGKIVKRWEPRQSVRVRWGDEFADLAIFVAASRAQDRYEEVMTGKRVARDSRSPSVGLIHDMLQRRRERSQSSRLSPSRSRRVTPESLEDDVSSPTRSTRAKSKSLKFNPSPPPAPTRAKSNTPPLSEEELEEVMDEFLADMFQLLRVRDFSELNAEQTIKCTDAWRAKKNSLIAAAA